MQTAISNHSDQQVVNMAALAREHAKGCKDNPSECPKCLLNRQFFDKQDGRILSTLLADKPARKQRWSLGLVSVTNFVARTTHNSKRAGLESRGNMTLFTDYNKRGGTI